MARLEMAIRSLSRQIATAQAIYRLKQETGEKRHETRGNISRIFISHLIQSTRIRDYNWGRSFPLSPCPLVPLSPCPPVPLSPCPPVPLSPCPPVPLSPCPPVPLSPYLTVSLLKRAAISLFCPWFSPSVVAIALPEPQFFAI